MTRLLGCLLLVLAVALPAEGQCVVRSRAVYSYPVATYAPVVYQTPVVAAVFTPLVVATVPAYSASFGAPDQGQQALIAELRALRQEVKSLRQLPMQQQPNAPEKGTAPNGNGNEFVNVLGARCAECHTAGKEKGKFAMFDAEKMLSLTPAQIGKVLEQSAQGTMPPPPRKPLTDQEHSLVALGLARMLQQAAAAK